MTKTDDDTSTALEPSSPQELAIAEFLAHANSLASEPPEEVQARILNNILTATSPEELMRAGEALPASELYGVPLRVTGIRAAESSFADGPDLYLHVDAVIMSNGDRVTFSCGARDITAKLIMADWKGWLPLNVIMEQSTKATKAGFYPVFLRMADDAGEPF